MKPEISAWLEDIQRSIEEIFDFLPSEQNYFDFEKYLPILLKEVETLLK